MANFVELQRFRLEENDVIRHSTFKRIRKNPELVPYEIRKPDDVLFTKANRGDKETLVQKHEVKLFQDRYNQNIINIIRSKNEQNDVIQESLHKIRDPNRTFLYFDSVLNDLKARDNGLPREDLTSMYSSYSSTPLEEVKTSKKGKLKAKRKRILSEQASSKLDISTLFTKEEYFGKCLDLKLFHQRYMTLTQTEILYLEYLNTFSQFSDPIRSPQYTEYLQELGDYLMDFFHRINPLDDITKLEGDITNQSHNKTDKPEGNGQVYCSACDKLFKDTIYQNHLSGKKHKKNAATDKITSGFLQTKIQVLSQRLSDTINETIANIERRQAMTERERMIEINQLHDDESGYTTIDSDVSDHKDNENDSDEDGDEEMFKELPLGADGRPIPFWLYKLQGLHQSYVCEICGNTNYKGRVTFEKHFSGPKHQQGLQFLGIDTHYHSVFSDITRIQDAMDLWRTMKKDIRAQEGELEDVVQVEDSHGNVLTARDYAELKSQGML